MEFATCINTFSYERFFLSDFLYELPYELHLLVLFTKNSILSIPVFFDEFCIFLYHICYNHPSNPIE